MALEGLQVFLEFRRPTSLAPLPGAGAFSSSDESDEWGGAYKQSLRVETSSAESIFLHLGRTNLQTFHFSALRTQETYPLPEQLPPGVRWLYPRSENEDLEQVVFTDMEVFVRFLDWKLPWTLKFHVLFNDPVHWNGTSVQEVAVFEAPEQSPVVVWQGTTEEAARRSVLEASKREARRKEAPDKRKGRSRGQRGRRGRGGQQRDAAEAVPANEAAADLEPEGDSHVYDSDAADADDDAATQSEQEVAAG